MTIGIMVLISTILLALLLYLDVKLQRKIKTKDAKVSKEMGIVIVGMLGTNLLSIIVRHDIVNTLRISGLVFIFFIIERIFFIVHPMAYEERLEKLVDTDFDTIEDYYFREKAFNFIGVIITILFIFHGGELIFNLSQILFIALFRNFIMRRQGVIQSITLLFVLHLGNLMNQHYIFIRYFEYLLLGLFFMFLIYFLYKDLKTKGKMQIILVTVGVGILLLVNVQISNTRLIRDPQLQVVIKEKYEDQYREKARLKEGDPRLQDITELELRSKFGIKTLDGIEHFVNLRRLTIERQDKLINYNRLETLNQLKTLSIEYPHSDFGINKIPKMESLETLTIYFGEVQGDEEVKLTNFPQLNTLSLMGSYKNKPVTLDITDAPNIEYMYLGINIKEIVGLEDAKNLNTIILYGSSYAYEEEIKRLRPDIDVN